MSSSPNTDSPASDAEIAPLDATVRSDRHRVGADEAPELGATVASRTQAPRVPRGTAVGRYLVLGQIGEGAMAAVFSAYDPDLDRKVAIKLLKLDSSSEAELQRARLLREAKAAARLSHPNVVAVYDAGAFDGQLFMAMELVEGLTLRAWLDERPRSRREILRAFVDAGAGLAAAHAAGMVHRDFKPDNVLVGADGRVRVSDFGLAHVEEPVAQAGAALGCGEAGGAPEATFTGRIAGTPAFMAPEQFEGRAVDARTDQFAFCVALWEALCGERPFAGEDFAAIRRSVLDGAVRPPPRDRPLPGWLKAVLLRGLSLRPDDRFPTLGLLLAALRRDRRRRLVRSARAAAAGLLVVGVLATAGLSRWRERTRCPREAAARAEKVFEAAPRPALPGALAAAGLSAPEAEEVRGAFERFAAGWSDAWRRQCELARGDPRQAAPVATCLERDARRARISLAAIVQQPAGPGFALRLADRLPIAGECLRPRAGGAGDIADELWTELEQVRVLSLLGRFAQVEQRLGALLAQAGAGAHALRAEALMLLAEAIVDGRGQHELAVEKLREAVREADAGGDDRASLLARSSLADLLSEGLDRREEAERVWLEAQAWLVRLGSPPELERTFATGRANLLSRLGRAEESLASYRRAVELAERQGASVSWQASTRINLASQYIEMSRYSEAVAENRRALDLIEGASFRHELDPIVAWGNIAVCELALGHAEAALAASRAVRRALDSLGEENDEGFRAWVDLLTAQSLELSGSPDQARPFFERALAGAGTLDSSSHSDALAGLARLELSEGRGERALELAEQALALTATRPWAQGTSVGSRFTLARVLRATGGDPARARALAQEALARLDGPEDGFVRGQLEAWLAEEPAASTAER